ncbi:MAG TPA: hypothetical protein PLF88_04255 [Opitutaceae bacterium]|nr:hypothetical protein [Opitutaceae bacterium]HRJ47456.1 hypothetical protein [Opitutaceae bacterium]
MPAPETTRRGKIARCPLHIREEVNRRLLDGQSGPTILKWLNSQEAVLKVLDEHFNEEPVSAQNLTEWRQGGYLDFKRRLEQIERTKQLSGYAVKLAEHGQAYAGNVAIVGGQLLEIFESLDVEEQKTLLKEKPATYIALVDVLARLEKSQADRIKAEAGRDMVEINKQRAEQAEAKLKLEREKHEVKTCELFLKFYADKKTREIAEGRGTREVKMEQLRLHFFPKPAADAEGG